MLWFCSFVLFCLRASFCLIKEPGIIVTNAHMQYAKGMHESSSSSSSFSEKLNMQYFLCAYEPSSFCCSEPNREHFNKTSFCLLMFGEKSLSVRKFEKFFGSKRRKWARVIHILWFIVSRDEEQLKTFHRFFFFFYLFFLLLFVSFQSI